MSQGLEVTELVRGELDHVEAVTQQVVLEAEVSQSVLDPVEQSLCYPPEAVVAKIKLFQWNV